LVNQQLSTSQIAELIREIAPSEHKTSIETRKPARFEYASGGNTLTVVCAPNGECLSARISISNAKPQAESPKPQVTVNDDAGEPAINRLLRKMFQMGASDLHLTSNHRPMVRVHGDMKEIPGENIIMHQTVAALLEPITPPANDAQFRDIHDTDFAHEIPGLARFRVKQGMTVLNDILFKLVTDKLVEPEEAYIKSVEKGPFLAMLKSKSIKLNLTGLDE